MQKTIKKFTTVFIKPVYPGKENNYASNRIIQWLAKKRV